MPINGRGGQWIAKLPSEVFDGVPENEFAMVRWAGRSGIQVPESALVKAKDVEGLPIQIEAERFVFLSRRFDRPDSGEEFTKRISHR